MNTLAVSLRNLIDRSLIKEEKKATTIIQSVKSNIAHLDNFKQLQILCHLWSRGDELTHSRYKESFIYTMSLEASRSYRELGGVNRRALKALRVHVHSTRNNQSLFDQVVSEGFTDELKHKVVGYFDEIDEHIPTSLPKREAEQKIWLMIQDDLRKVIATLDEHLDMASKVIMNRIMRILP